MKLLKVNCFDVSKYLFFPLDYLVNVFLVLAGAWVCLFGLKSKRLLKAILVVLLVVGLSDVFEKELFKHLFPNWNAAKTGSFSLLCIGLVALIAALAALWVWYHENVGTMWIVSGLAYVLSYNFILKLISHYKLLGEQLLLSGALLRLAVPAIFAAAIGVLFVYFEHITFIIVFAFAGTASLITGLSSLLSKCHDSWVTEAWDEGAWCFYFGILGLTIGFHWKETTPKLSEASLV